jgi:L-2-hydroxyglutarate oxidase LhgO
MSSADFLIVGGGVIGLSIARELKRRHGRSRIVLIEKEADCGLHASGRNSGVLHAGFYYTADSLKARFTRDGNRALREYCGRKKIPVNQCGKLVVARNESELGQLDELLRRGRANGVELQPMTEKEARAIEPRVKTFQRAIFSPTTATADPAAVLQAMKADAIAEGIEIQQNAAYLAKSGRTIKTARGDVDAGFVVNAAGLYADRVARDFGFSENYRILPFKGIYLYSEEPAGSLRTNIYPVPDLRNPFLGVHFTLLADGRSKIGPTAIPAFWREQYKGLSNFRLGELGEIIFRDLGLLFFSGFDFKRLAAEETLKYFKRRLVSLAAELVEGVKLEDYRHWGKPGIRAQLLNIKTKKLEMDFVVQGDANSLHVLNAVSPAWTCSIPFASYICDKIEGTKSESSQPSPASPTTKVGHVGMPDIPSPPLEERVRERRLFVSTNLSQGTGHVVPEFRIEARMRFPNSVRISQTNSCFAPLDYHHAEFAGQPLQHQTTCKCCLPLLGGEGSRVRASVFCRRVTSRFMKATSFALAD